MLRQSLARSAWRTGRRAAAVPRAFATTPRRSAEVELTIGKPLAWLFSTQLATEGVCLLTVLQMERRSRSKVWLWRAGAGGALRCGRLEGLLTWIASRLGSDPGLRKGRSYCAQVSMGELFCWIGLETA